MDAGDNDRKRALTTFQSDLDSLDQTMHIQFVRILFQDCAKQAGIEPTALVFMGKGVMEAHRRVDR
jgi:hypothetical protein